MQNKLSDKSAKVLAGSSIGGFGLASIFGTCGGLCALSAFPLSAFLTSIGLGALTIWLGKLQLPLIALAIIMGFVALRIFVKQGNTKLSAVFGLILGGFLIFGISEVRSSNLLSRSSFQGQNINTIDTTALRDRFNAQSDKVRIISLLSPACSWCIKGYDAMTTVFSEHGSSKLVGELVWLPILQDDSRALASEVSSSMKDQRVENTWSDTREIGNVFKRTLNLSKIAWDIYLVYDVGAKWVGELPPKPAFWMHQLDGEDPALELNTETFSKKVGELLN